MSEYRVVCANWLLTSADHRHITDVGTGTAGQSRRWSSFAVRCAILDGDRFYLIDPSTNASAEVEAYDCRCGLKTLRCSLGTTTDEDLDKLPRLAAGDATGIRSDSGVR
jgi:hypothetical protein